MFDQMRANVRKNTVSMHINHITDYKHSTRSIAVVDNKNYGGIAVNCLIERVMHLWNAPIIDSRTSSNYKINPNKKL